MEKVLLLNNNWEYHCSLDWRHAVRLMFRPNCVEVLKYSDKEIRPGFRLPLVLRLLKAIRKFYGKAVMWSKENLFIRDDYTCQYCGIKLASHKLTVDHVLPVSRGGKTTWENTVAACQDCNCEKDDKALHEYKNLKRKPVQPTIMEFIRKKTRILGIEQILIDLGVYQ